MGVIVPDAVERYLATLNRSHGAVLDDIARAGAQRNLPLVDAEVGALLRVLATAVSATRILEIGTATGYSGIWLAGALPPGGSLFTLEMDQDRARDCRVQPARRVPPRTGHGGRSAARRRVHLGEEVRLEPDATSIVRSAFRRTRRGERIMTIDQWLQAALADADRRGLPALKPLLEALARATRALRAADFNDDATK